MKIVVTGALGHFGSALLRSLDSLPTLSSVVAIDDLSTQRYCSLFNFHPRYQFQLIQDNLSELDLENILVNSNCIVHLAALSEPELSVKRPDEFKQINFSLTQHVAISARNAGVPLIFPSTTSVYRTSKEALNDQLGAAKLVGQTPYANGKLAEEQYIASKLSTEAVPYVILRFATLCGYSPGMRFHTAVNRFCWQAANGNPITIYAGAKHVRRPYLTISDATFSVLRILDSGEYSSVPKNVVSQSLPLQKVTSIVIEEAAKLGIKCQVKEIPSHADDFLDVDLAPSSDLQKLGDASRKLQNAVRETLQVLYRA